MTGKYDIPEEDIVFTEEDLRIVRLLEEKKLKRNIDKSGLTNDEKLRFSLGGAPHPYESTSY